MNVPQSWGLPAPDSPGVFIIGGGDWLEAWSPQTIHPHALKWLAWSARFGPSGKGAPGPDLWAYALQTRDLTD